MVDIISSAFVAAVGTIVVNLAKRGVIVRIGVESSVLTGDILTMSLSYMKGDRSTTIREVLTESEMVQISDITTVCDALFAKIQRGVAPK